MASDTRWHQRLAWKALTATLLVVVVVALFLPWGGPWGITTPMVVMGDDD